MFKKEAARKYKRRKINAKIKDILNSGTLNNFQRKFMVLLPNSSSHNHETGKVKNVST